MTLATDIAGDIAAACAEYGRDVTLTEPTDGTYVPSTGYVTGGGIDPTTVKALVLGYADYHVDGTRIMAGDRRIIIAGPLDPKPEAGWRVTVGDVVYTVVRGKPYEVGGGEFAYVLQVRNPTFAGGVT